MKNQKSILFCLSGLCLTLAGGAVLGQQKPLPTPPPASPDAPQTPAKTPVNPLLTNPAAPKPVRIFTYTLIPFETLEPSVQMTPDQSVKIKPIYSKLDADTAALRAAAKTPEEKNALNQKIRDLQTEANKQVDAALDPAQRKKAEGLIFEMMEMISVGVSPQMLRELKLTPDQRAAIVKIVGEVQEKMKALPAADRRPKYNAIMEAERVKIAPLLTPAQKVIYDRYDTQGKPLVAPKPTPVAPAANNPTPAPPASGAPMPEKKP